MGHVSSVALGISINISNQTICIDGDGSLIMHMGTLPTIGKYSKNNFKHGNFLAWNVKRNSVNSVSFKGNWYDIGSLDSYSEAQKWLERRP